jgi:hypothetical protein
VLQAVQIYIRVDLNRSNDSAIQICWFIFASKAYQNEAFWVISMLLETSNLLSQLSLRLDNLLQHKVPGGIAAVLVHELGHIITSHAAEPTTATHYERVLKVLDRWYKDNFQLYREQERETGDIGMFLLAEARFDPRHFSKAAAQHQSSYRTLELWKFLKKRARILLQATPLSLKHL